MKKKSPNLVIFGNHLRQLRKKLGFSSQEDFAAACKIDRAYLGCLERGEHNPTLQTLITIAKTLKVELSDLLPSIKKFTD